MGVTNYLLTGMILQVASPFFTGENLYQGFFQKINQLAAVIISMSHGVTDSDFLVGRKLRFETILLKHFGSSKSNYGLPFLEIRNGVGIFGIC